MNKDIYVDAVNDIKADPKLIIETARKMEENKIRKTNIYRYGSVAACIVVLIAALLIKGIPGKNTKYPEHLNAGTNIQLHNGKGTLYMNEIAGAISGKLRIPEDAYTKDLTMKELSELFGRDPMPVVPSDFKPTSNTVNIIFNHDGSMYYMNTFIYAKNPEDMASPEIDVKLNKNALPKKDCIFKSPNQKESTIGDTKLVVGSMKMGENYDQQGKPGSYYDFYYAQFIYKGIGYDISAKRVSGDEFIKILQSIIK